MNATNRYVDMLNELLDVTDGLTEWEINFLDSLYNWDGMFTDPQCQVLEKIWNKVFNR